MTIDGVRRVKPGQQLVCIRKEKWVNTSLGPRFNEVVTVHAICSCYPDSVDLVGYLFDPADGFPVSFRNKWFEPLVTDSQLEEELKTIEQFV